jgi:hypothetical protein
MDEGYPAHIGGRDKPREVSNHTTPQGQERSRSFRLTVTKPGIKIAGPFQGLVFFTIRDFQGNRVKTGGFKVGLELLAVKFVDDRLVMIKS